MTNSLYNWVPRIYVGTYEKYNNGSLKGKWVDLTKYDTIEDFYTYCSELHKDEPDPELMFQDFENIPDQFIDESWISEKFWDLMELQLSEDEQTAFFEWLEISGYDLKDNEMDYLCEKFQESHIGNYESGKDYAMSAYYEETPEDQEFRFINYIDWDWVWSGEYRAAGWHITENGNVFSPE